MLAYVNERTRVVSVSPPHTDNKHSCMGERRKNMISTHKTTSSWKEKEYNHYTKSYKFLGSCHERAHNRYASVSIMNKVVIAIVMATSVVTNFSFPDRHSWRRAEHSLPSLSAKASH